MTDTRLRLVALETIASLVSEMGSSPVDNTTIITRQQIEIFADYVTRVRPEGPASVTDENATTFTHLRDAGGSRVPVIFDYGPFKLPTEPKERGIYRWRVMGKHRLKGCDLTGGNGEPQLFYEDGTSPYYPQIRLIRDTKSESAPG